MTWQGSYTATTVVHAEPDLHDQTLQSHLARLILCFGLAPQASVTATWLVMIPHYYLSRIPRVTWPGSLSLPGQAVSVQLGPIIQESWPSPQSCLNLLPRATWPGSLNLLYLARLSHSYLARISKILGQAPP